MLAFKETVKCLCNDAHSPSDPWQKAEASTHTQGVRSTMHNAHVRPYPNVPLSIEVWREPT